jgi:hypothetical protein
MFDSLRKLKDIDTAPRLLSPDSRFDDYLQSKRVVENGSILGGQCIPNASKGSSVRFRFMRRIV